MDLPLAAAVWSTLFWRSSSVVVGVVGVGRKIGVLELKSISLE